MKFNFEIIIGDRYEATDYLSDDVVHQSLLKMQKQDILKAEMGMNIGKTYQMNFLNY